MNDWRIWKDHALELFLDLTSLERAYDDAVAHSFWIDWSVMLRSLGALFLVAAILLFSLRAVRLLLPRAGIPLRWSSAMLFGTWLVTVGFHLLRWLGLFNLPAVLACCGLLLFAALRIEPTRAPLRWVLRREQRAARALHRLMFRGRYSLINAVLVGFGALYALRSLVIPPLGWDTLTYHAPRAVIWLQSGQFSFDLGPGPLSLYRGFFGGGELLMALAMLPFHSDLLVNLAGIVQWVAIGLAVWALARGLGLREPFAACSAGVCMFIPPLQYELNSGYVEVPLNAALFHGMAMAIYGLRRPTAPTIVLAAMSLGVAGGMKLTALPPALVVFVALGVRVLFTQWPLAHRLRSLAVASVCITLPVLPWLLFAWRDTGYPLSPMPVEVLGIKLGVPDPALHWYQEQLAGGSGDWQVELPALRRVFTGIGLEVLNESLSGMAVIPLLFLPAGLFALGRRRPLLAGVVTAAIAVALLTHFSRGLAPVRILWSVSASRFLIPALALAIVVSFAWCRPGGLFSGLYRRLMLAYPITSALVAVPWGRAFWETRETVVIGVMLTLATTLVSWTLTRGTRTGYLLSVGVFAFAVSFLQLRRDTTQQQAFAESFALHGSPRAWAALVPYVDEPDKVHRIAITGGPWQSSDQWFQYGFFGRRFQNELEYVPPTKDGKVAHFGPHHDLASQASREAWEKRLEAAQIDEVLTFYPRSIEQAWMDEAPDRFVRLGGTEHGGLYRRLRADGHAQR